MRSIQKRIEANVRRAAAGLLLLNGVACNDPLAGPIAPAHPDDPAPRRGGTLHLANFGDIRSLDPAFVSDALGTEAMALMFSGLVDFDEKGEVTPDLAERWEIADEGRTYRFFLHPGALFHDGNEVTATDVVRSIERSLHPSSPNPYSSFYDNIVGYADYTEKKAEHLAGLAVDGRYVVAIRLRDPDATFLPIFALQPLRPVCPTAGTRYVDTWLPCGAGPFRLMPGGWDRGRSLTVVRFEGYFRPGLPYLDAVNWSYGMNFSTQRFKFSDGATDILRDFLQPDILRFQRDPRWAPFTAYEVDREIHAESMNTEMPPFDNIEVRRAVAAAIDRSHIVAIKSTNLLAVGQAIPAGVPGHNVAFPGQVYDYAAALEHMKKAGYPFDPKTGRGGYDKVIPYPVYKQGLFEYSGQLLQQDLAKIGIKIDIRIMNFPSWLALTHRRGKAALSPTSWKQDYPDAFNFLDPLFGSAAINDEDTANTAFYKSPRFDEVMARARRELDTKKRYALYDEANRIVCDDAPWAFTSSYRWYDAWQPYVKNFRPHPVWTMDVRNTWLDRPSDPRSSSRARALVGVPASVLGGLVNHEARAPEGRAGLVNHEAR